LPVSRGFPCKTPSFQERKLFRDSIQKRNQVFKKKHDFGRFGGFEALSNRAARII
jgi:hypothetical protein